MDALSLDFDVVVALLYSAVGRNAWLSQSTCRKAKTVSKTDLLILSVLQAVVSLDTCYCSGCTMIMRLSPIVASSEKVLSTNGGKTDILTRQHHVTGGYSQQLENSTNASLLETPCSSQTPTTNTGAASHIFVNYSLVHMLLRKLAGRQDTVILIFALSKISFTKLKQRSNTNVDDESSTFQQQLSIHHEDFEGRICISFLLCALLPSF